MDLPSETWREVATYLENDAASVARLACSCRSARQAIEEQGPLWKRLLESNFKPVQTFVDKNEKEALSFKATGGSSPKRKRNKKDFCAFPWRECYRSWASGKPRSEDTVLRETSGRVNALVLDQESESNVGDVSKSISSCWSADADGTIHQWNVSRGQVTMTYRHENSLAPSVECAASCGSGLLVTGTADKKIKLLDSRTRNAVWSVSAAHYDEVLSIACSTSSGKIVSGGADDCVKVWDMRWMENALLELDTLHGGSVFCIAIDEAKQRVYTGSGDKTISLWDLSLGHWVAQAHAHTGDVYDLCSLSCSGALSASSDGTIREWKVEGKDKWFNELQNVSTLDLSTPLTCLEMLGGEERCFLAGTWKGDVVLGNLKGGKKAFSKPISKRKETGDNEQANSAVTAITGTQECVVTGFDNGAVRFSRMSTTIDEVT